MQRGDKIIFSEIDYTVQKVGFNYNTDKSPRIFYINTTVEVPSSSDKLTIGFPLDTVLQYVADANEGMAKYLRKVIEGFDDKPDKELLAFESLEEDGFDLVQMVKLVLEQIHLKVE